MFNVKPLTQEQYEKVFSGSLLLLVTPEGAVSLRVLWRENRNGGKGKKAEIPVLYAQSGEAWDADPLEVIEVGADGDFCGLFRVFDMSACEDLLLPCWPGMRKALVAVVEEWFADAFIWGIDAESDFEWHAILTAQLGEVASSVLLESENRRQDVIRLATFALAYAAWLEEHGGGEVVAGAQ